MQVWGTGIRGLMRGVATLPQGNQELLVANPGSSGKWPLKWREDYIMQGYLYF